jgi:hypothetical protein
VLAASAATRSDSERVVCFNNLRMLGQAILAFEASHGGKVSWRTPLNEGGTLPTFSKPGAAWYEWSVHSNYLTSCRILACPADSGVRGRSVIVARTLEEYRSAGFRDRATSYVLNMDVTTGNPNAWLSGDRNLRVDPTTGGCSSFVNNYDTIWRDSSQLAWTNVIHGLQGHVLLNDGSVRFTDTTQLRALLLTNNNDLQNSFHFLKAN